SSTLSDPPPYVIQFFVDNSGVNVKSSIKTITCNFESGSMSSTSYLASTLNSAINTEGDYTITVNSVPGNGEYFTISTSNKKINVVMNATNVAPSPPSKPDLSTSTIFVDYLTTDSTAIVRDKIYDTIRTDLGSIPTANDLSLIAPSSDLEYYVYL
ncbi:MAG: hypothetical protein R3321_09745, partial [Nitrososphaeraceae archaeon]|nr:hypothetical protein [Nitrososphaeraceae archaeon]